jgi:uncharacterized membrane protein (DUF106 family)
MQGRRSQIASLQSDFYRNQFRKTLRWLIVTTAIIFILLAAIIYKMFTRPKETYYANTTRGVIVSMPEQG